MKRYVAKSSIRMIPVNPHETAGRSGLESAGTAMVSGWMRMFSGIFVNTGRALVTADAQSVFVATNDAANWPLLATELIILVD